MKLAPLLACVTLLICGAISSAQAVKRHRFSWDGQQPSGSTLKETKVDLDGDTYRVYEPTDLKKVWYAIVYVDPKKYWKDQMHIVAFDISNLYKPQPIVQIWADWGEIDYSWDSVIKDFVPKSITYMEGAKSWSNSGNPPGSITWQNAILIGAYRAGYTFWIGSYGTGNPSTSNMRGFVPGGGRTTFAVGENPFASPGNNTSTGTTTGGTTSGGQPAPNLGGLLDILSWKFWKDLLVYLFVPSQQRIDNFKNAFTQFTTWGPFKLVADLATSLGSISANAPGAEYEKYNIQMPSFYIYGNNEPLTGKMDLRPYSPWLLLLRTLMLGLVMMRIFAFWWSKYEKILRSS